MPPAINARNWRSNHDSHQPFECFTGRNRKLSKIQQKLYQPATVAALPSFEWPPLLSSGGAFREKVKLGPLLVSPMGLGTWSWGNRFLWDYDESMDPELQQIFNEVISKGINLFDTADSYGTGRLDGKSEQLLGKFISEARVSESARSKLHVATKFASYPWRLTSGSVVEACKSSLSRLGLERLALGQLHWSPSNYAPWQEGALRSGIAECYEQGLVAAVGVSNYGARQLKSIARELENRDVPLASVQIQYSLLSRGSAQEAVKATADDLGIRVIAYSPLALGLLSGKYRAKGKLPKGPRASLFNSLLPEVEPLLAVLEAIAQERKKTMSQVAINWCMVKGTIPIPGAKSLEQAADNLGSLGFKLSSGEMDELDTAASRLKKGMIQNIFQTS